MKPHCPYIQLFLTRLLLFSSVALPSFCSKAENTLSNHQDRLLRRDGSPTLGVYPWIKPTDFLPSPACMDNPTTKNCLSPADIISKCSSVCTDVFGGCGDDETSFTNITCVCTLYDTFDMTACEASCGTSLERLLLYGWVDGTFSNEST
jgi:hypothetical protein